MMYYKIIGDRTVFSNCKSIQTNEGIWISNPTDASHVERALVSPFIGKIYEFKIWNKTRLVCHFVPCKRSSDNVYGLYDLVQRKFYTSATNYAYTGG